MDYITEILNWTLDFLPQAVRVFIYAFLAYWIYRAVLWRILKTFEEEKYRKKDKEELRKRLVTLKSVLSKTGKIGIFIVVTMVLLGKAGLDVGPMVAGFGIVGIAVGFGAQSLVKDIVNGIFILAEGQYSTDDIVEIAGKKGQVEGITLRKTILRDLDGIVHHIPNSEITTASNMSQKWAKVNINIPIAYEDKIGYVYKILEGVTKELQEDDEFRKDIIEDFEIMGVDKFTDSGYEIKIVGKTRSMKRWDVGRELRKRIKEEFDERGVEIPYPHRVMILKDVDKKAEKVKGLRVTEREKII